MTDQASAQERRQGVAWGSQSSMPALGALLLSLPAAATEPAQYQKTYRFDPGRILQAGPPSPAPAPDEVSRQVSELQARQAVLNGRLAALDYGRSYRSSPPDAAGIFPLAVTRFSCTCARNDEDKTCEGLTFRLGIRPGYAPGLTPVSHPGAT